MPSIDVNQIYEGLYQGAYPPYGDELAKRGFDVLVLAAGENQNEELYPGIQVICAPGDDDVRVNRMMRFLPTWILAAQRVAQLLDKDKRVLVTCMAGLNRSGMVTAMALHLRTGWSGEECVEHIRSCRPMALCNDTFAKWLIDNLKETESPTLPMIDVESTT